MPQPAIAGPGDLRGPAQNDEPIAIVGGEQTESDEFVNVVAVVAGTGLCTGTVVAPNLVLTAGHCLADLPPSAQVSVFYGDEIIQTQGIAATAYGAHPDFCATCKEDIFDYGYVVTSENFIAPFARPITTQEQWDETMNLGGEVTLVGFGEDPDVTGNAALGVKRKVTTTIGRFSEQGLEFFAGGDDRDSCQGDSGGPAFVTLPDGTTRLAGITSRGSSPCGKGGFYGAPYPALCWVREETGIDLLDGDCSSCDCVDTTPPPSKDDGCRIGGPERGGPGQWWALAVIAVVGLARRTRRHS